MRGSSGAGWWVSQVTDETTPNLGGFGVSSNKKSNQTEAAAVKGKRRKTRFKSIAKGLRKGGVRLRGPVHYAAYMVLALFAVLVDPFRWQETTDALSQDLTYRMLIGPLYPTDHQNDITVILFNEATLNHLGTTWPVPLGTHAEILKRIREMGPRAVMVDFIFPDERQDQTRDDLLNTIDQFKNPEKFVPLYFARAEGANLNWIRPDLSNATLTSIVNGTEDGISRTYEPCSKLSGGRSECACEAESKNFQVCPADARPGTPDSPVALTAAFQVYGHAADLPDEFDLRDPKPMEVVWSNRVNKFNDDWMRKQTPWGMEKLCLDIGSGFWDWLKRNLSGSEEDSLRQTCPYTTTIAAHDLLKSKDDQKLHNELWVRLQRKFVFYGADLAGLEDSVLPATHVKLPGVYLHAMALDNLLTFEGKYKRSFATLFGTNFAAQHLTIFVAVLIAVIVVAFARSKAVIRAHYITVGKAMGWAYFRKLWRRWRYWIVFHAAAIVVVLTVFWILYSYVALAPKNWIGYWALLLGLSGMAMARMVESFLARIVDHLVPTLEPLIFEERQT
jgi:CHASE2 domain-containing sensor protein